MALVDTQVEFNWYGDRVLKQALEAARKALDETTAACVDHAAQNTPFDTGAARGSVQLEPAEIEGEQVVAEWGSYEFAEGNIAPVGYYIWLNYGTARRPGGFMLENAADAEYPGFGRRMARHFDGNPF